MNRHLLFPVLIFMQNYPRFPIPVSCKLYSIASRGNQATKFLNYLLKNFIQAVKVNEDFVGDISKQTATSLFSSPKLNRINFKRHSSWGFSNIVICFIPLLFKIPMACFGSFQCVICGICG